MRLLSSASEIRARLRTQVRTSLYRKCISPRSSGLLIASDRIRELGDFTNSDLCQCRPQSLSQHGERQITRARRIDRAIVWNGFSGQIALVVTLIGRSEREKGVLWRPLLVSGGPGAGLEPALSCAKRF